MPHEFYEHECYCPFCAWVALVHSPVEYCGALILGAEVQERDGSCYSMTLECTRMPGHDGPHVACQAPKGLEHKLATWVGEEHTNWNEWKER